MQFFVTAAFFVCVFFLDIVKKTKTSNEHILTFISEMDDERSIIELKQKLFIKGCCSRLKLVFVHFMWFIIHRRNGYEYDEFYGLAPLVPITQQILTMVFISLGPAIHFFTYCCCCCRVMHLLGNIDIVLYCFFGTIFLLCFTDFGSDCG